MARDGGLQYLDYASRSIVIFGCLNVLYAVIVPLFSHLFFPSAFLFVSEDAEFTGVSWVEVLVFERSLAFWILLLMDTGRAGMMGFGTLTIFVSWKALRKGESWALKAVLVSGVLSGLYPWTVTGLYLMRGLYNGVSGVSLGVWVSILFFAPWVVGLVLARRGMKEPRMRYSSVPT